MDNTGTVLAANIQKFRKQSRLTQEELSEKLGVTYQAVSKWENAKSAPDISLLPRMADLFGCYIDELFSHRTKENQGECPILPWQDDGMIRGVVFEGKQLLQVSDALIDKFTFEIIGDAKSVQSECSIAVEGSVSGGCNAGREVAIGGHLSGGCNAGTEITVGGHLSGGCNCGSTITCGGNLSGDVSCGAAITVGGDVEAVIIKGNVTCNFMKCDKIEGDVVINGEDCALDNH